MEKKVIIYTLSDTTGVKYVGKTHNFKQRYNRHLFDARSKKRFNKRDSWIKSLLNKGELPKMEIIEEVLINDWAFWEQYWINQIKAWGFSLKNMTDGGDGAYGRKHSEETLKKMSDVKKGKIPKNIELFRKSTMKGKITQYDLEGNFIKEWESAGEILRTLSINNLTLVMTGKRNTAGGFIWRYSDIPLTEKDVMNIKNKHDKLNPKIILQFDKNGVLIREWDSVNLAEKIYSAVPAVLNGKRKSAGGFIWKYKCDNINKIIR